MSKRSSYEVGFKLTVVGYAEKHGNRRAEKEFGVSEKVVRGWRKQKEDLEEMPKTKKAARYSMSPYRSLEKELCEWILDLKSKGLVVSRQSIRSKALQLAPNYNVPYFKSSAGWCSRFMNRCGLSLWPTNYIPKDNEKVNNFEELVQKKHTMLDISPGNEVNNDETSNNFNMPEITTRNNMRKRTDINLPVPIVRIKEEKDEVNNAIQHHEEDPCILEETPKKSTVDEKALHFIEELRDVIRQEPQEMEEVVNGDQQHEKDPCISKETSKNSTVDEKALHFTEELRDVIRQEPQEMEEVVNGDQQHEKDPCISKKISKNSTVYEKALHFTEELSNVIKQEPQEMEENGDQQHVAVQTAETALISEQNHQVINSLNPPANFGIKKELKAKRKQKKKNENTPLNISIKELIGKRKQKKKNENTPANIRIKELKAKRKQKKINPNTPLNISTKELIGKREQKKKNENTTENINIKELMGKRKQKKKNANTPLNISIKELIGKRIQKKKNENTMENIKMKELKAKRKQKKRNSCLNKDELNCRCLKQFKCQPCEKRLGEKYTLQYHLYLDTGVKPFKCKMCHKNRAKQFQSRYALWMKNILT